MIFDADIEKLSDVNKFINEYLKRVSCPNKACMHIETSVEEIFVNIAHYAYDRKGGKVIVNVDAKPDLVTITFIDSGLPYNPLEKPDPDITLPADKRKIGGLGIYMTKKLMDDITYEYKNGNNVLTMKKNIR